MPDLPKAPRTGASVTAWLTTKMAEGYTFTENTCLQRMHLAAGLPYGHDYDPADGHDPWAIEAFEAAHHAVHTTNPADVPAEVYVYFRSKTPGRPGHICWSPHGGAKVITTDQPKTKRFNHSTIPAIEDAWGMNFVGYAYDLNEYMVGHLPPPPAPKPPAHPTTTEDKMRALLKDLTTVCVKHGVTRVYGARVLLWGAAVAASGGRLDKINAGRKPLRGMDDPK